MADEKKEKDFTKEYELLSQRYRLPSLTDLEREFAIGQVECSGLLPRNILIKMAERLEHAAKMLEELIHPDSSLSNMLEAESFQDDEKKAIFELLRKISFYNNSIIFIDYNYNEHEAMVLIAEAYEFWTGIKPEFVAILSKLRDAWKNDSASKAEQSYFG